MGKISLLYLTFILTCIVGGQTVAVAADSIVRDEPAKIEGLCYSAMLGPVVKENWPDLRSFNITSVTGENVGAFSKSEAVVGPGPCSITVEVKTRQRGSATLTLTFEAEAGGKYVLRPVYRGNGIQASIQNSDTGEFVARTWPLNKKPKLQPEPTSLLITPRSAM